VESREYEILTAEEVDKLKKVGPALRIANPLRLAHLYVGTSCTICETLWTLEEASARD
jgi:hypothetical protein